MDRGQLRERIGQEYRRLENRFLELTEYVPNVPDLDDSRYQFGSPRAATFGLDCCTWLETLLRDSLHDSRLDDVNGIERIRERNQDMDGYRVVFEENFTFSTRGYRLRNVGGERIRPFRSWEEEENPEWFRIYSRYKHDRFELAERFTFGHTLEAFVALSIVVSHGISPGNWVPRQSLVLEDFHF